MAKVYVIKSGDLYVTADGGLSPNQADALRVDVGIDPTPRPVRLNVRS